MRGDKVLLNRQRTLSFFVWSGVKWGIVMPYIKGKKKRIPNLGVCVKLLLAAHGISVVTFIIDTVSPVNITTGNPFINLLISWLNSLIEYDGLDTDTMNTMVSSVLVVWTFITAVFIFYMEKKDTLYCGVRQSEIVLFDVSRRVRYALFILFFIELLFWMLAILIYKPVTLVYLSVLYAPTAGCILWGVGCATSQKMIKRRYFDLIFYEFEHRIPGSLEQELPSFSAFLGNIFSFGEREWDLLLEILSQVFAGLCDVEDEEKRKEAGKLSYRVVRSVLENTEDTGKKKDFLTQLGHLIYRRVESAPRAVDILTSMLLPAVEFTDSRGDSFYVMALSGIADKDIRQELLIRGIVYSCYLEFLESPVITGYPGRHYAVRCELRTKAAENAGTNDQKYKVSFVAKIQRASSVRGFTIEQVVRRL